VTPVLQAVGSKTIWVGEQLGQATALKLACNAWVASLTTAVGQSVALAKGFGLDPGLFLEAIKGGATDTPYAQVKGGQMINGDFGVSFAVEGVLKDLALITAAAMEAGVDAALLKTLQRSYQRATDRGHGKDDMAAVYTAFQTSNN
jgi:3-hydroxyisobutyrate dehydrogenase